MKLTFPEKLLKQKSTKNLIAGLTYQAFSLVLGLMLPYLFITNLGSESNGLLNSVGQVFTCLGLLEAGVGATTIQALYKPIAGSDRKSINEILSATSIYYKKTGFWYAVSVALLTFVYPFFVESTIDASTIRWVILLQGGGAVINYLVQAKYCLYLKAAGKNYILTAFMTAMLIFRNVGKIIALQMGYRIIAVQVIQFITIVLEAWFIYFYIKRNYPWLTVNESPNYQAISQKNSVLLQSVAWMVFNHTDILVLTVFSRNLSLVSVYSVYALIFEAGQNLLNEVRGSFQYKLGEKTQKGQDAFENYFTEYSGLIIALSFTVLTTIYVLSVPFIKLYTASVKDVDYLIALVPELFFCYKVLYGIRAVNKQVIEVKGYFEQTQKIPIIEAITNITISIFLVIRYGIVGVLIGTVISLLISMTLYMHFLKLIIHTAVIKQIVQILFCLPVTMFAIMITNGYSINIQNWGILIVYGVMVGAISVLMYFGIYIGIKRLGGKMKC